MRWYCQWPGWVWINYGWVIINSFTDISSDFQFEEQMFEHSYINCYSKLIKESFTIHVQAPMEWIWEICADPEIPKSWWPIKIFHSKNGVETQLYDDLNSGSDWWNGQDNLGSKGILAPLSFYADSTNISSFNGKKFHPVIARFAPIPSYIRNGFGRGGGTLIGYIPLVSRFFNTKHNIKIMVTSNFIVIRLIRLQRLKKKLIGRLLKNSNVKYIMSPPLL